MNNPKPDILQRKRMAAEVAAACATDVREITVTVIVKARVADDSPVAPLVVKALRELIQKEPDEAEGMFESRAGLDVSWKTETREVPNYVGH